MVNIELAEGITARLTRRTAELLERAFAATENRKAWGYDDWDWSDLDCLWEEEAEAWEKLS